jgi:hypothetical protein
MFTIVLLALAKGSDINSVEQLNEAIANGSNNKIGSLSYANYVSVETLLHGASSVVIKNLGPLEQSVLNGSLIAGVTSSSPDGCDEDFVCFSSGLVTARGIMFAPGVSQLRRNLINYALVTVLTNGNVTSIESKYTKNYGMQGVFVDNCPWSTAFWNITGLSPDDYNFRVAGIRANWGYQGDYTKDEPTGFWPEIYNAIEASIDANFTRQLYSDSDGVMSAVIAGEADITDAYWTVSTTWNSMPAVELYEWSCIVLGSNSVFWVKKSTTTSAPAEDASGDLILAGTLAGLAFCAFLLTAGFSYYLVKKEKQGEPVFLKSGVEETKSFGI